MNIKLKRNRILSDQLEYFPQLNKKKRIIYETLIYWHFPNEIREKMNLFSNDITITVDEPTTAVQLSTITSTELITTSTFIANQSNDSKLSFIFTVLNLFSNDIIINCRWVNNCRSVIDNYKYRNDHNVDIYCKSK